MYRFPLLSSVVVFPALVLMAFPVVAAPVSVDSSSVREVVDEDVRFGVGVTTSVNQRPFLGVGSQQDSLPYFSFRFGRVAMEGLDFTVDLFTPEQQTLALIVTPRFYEVKASFADGGELIGIDETNDTWFAGLNYRVHLGEYHVVASALKDVGGESAGTEITMTVNRPYRFGRFALVPSAGLIWQDKKLVEHFYGVDQQEAQLGRPVYGDQSSLNYQVSATALWQVHRNWQVLAAFKAEQLGGGIADSPIIEDDQINSALLGFVYRF
ncbi:MAG: MipA/OmpV family protein [Gammaproteobacteria bacterium]|jgi:outer membrane scaffolding protein for murein synthesis (MipA/OmpV family)|nr:MipA/OmpV family protein [Gammaproteobacteria bacterium]|tara:strand:- start:41256 stop:42056 length:801 start_codon:yes stop_codon:yes gene_type:complete